MGLFRELNYSIIIIVVVVVSSICIAPLVH